MITTFSSTSEELAAGLLAHWPASGPDVALWAHRIIDVLGYRRITDFNTAAGRPTPTQVLSLFLSANWPDMKLVAPALSELVVEIFGYRLPTPSSQALLPSRQGTDR